MLDAIPVERAVLIPCSDDLILRAAGLSERFRERFYMSLPPTEAVRTYTDKVLFADALEAYDVPHPRTLTGRDGLEQLSETELGGFFLKPRNSQAFSSHYRIKGVRVAGSVSAAEDIDRFLREGFEVQLQEVIPGPVTNEYHIDGFMDKSGRMVAAMARQRIRMYPTDFGNSTMMLSIPMETLGPALGPLLRLLEGLQHRGIFSADFKWDQRDGLFKLLEINSRPWWQVEFSTLCGVNVCAMTYHDAVGEELPTVSDYAVDRRFRILVHDTRAFLDMRKRGGETLGGWLASLKGATDAINRFKDPLPSLWFPIEVAVRFVRRLLSRAGMTRNRSSQP